MKKLIITLLTFLLVSCSFTEIPEDDFNDMTDLIPRNVIFKINIIKRDWNYESWEYESDIKCGYWYDEWMIPFNEDNVCGFYCVEVPLCLNLNTVIFNEVQECLDYKALQTKNTK